MNLSDGKSNARDMNQKTTIRIFTAALVAFLLALILGATRNESLHVNAPSNKDQVFKQLAKTVEKINAGTPVMVDSVTRLDHVVAGKGRELILKYTLINRSAGELPTEELERQLRPSLEKTYTEGAMKGLREMSVSVRYLIYSREDTLLVEIVMAPPPKK